MLLITYTLLVLYTLPLFILLFTDFVSTGFIMPSSWIEFSIALCGIYLASARDTLGTVVVPLVTAYSATSLQREDTIGRDTKCIFFVLVAIFILSILVYCSVKTRLDILLAQLTETDQSILSTSKEKLITMTESYVKETLAYIALVLGISQSLRTSSKGGGK